MGGAGAVVAGKTLFVDVPLVPFPLLFGGLVIPLNIWLAATGLLMFGAGVYEQRVVVLQWKNIPSREWPNTGLLF